MGIFGLVGGRTVKTILFVTGTRADFGKLEPLANAAIAAGFSVHFFVTGMHLMKKYGSTFSEVRKVQGAEFYDYVNQREGDSLDSILAKTIVGFSDFISENPPDLVVIHGDRIEATAVSLVCATNYIYSAHIEGGEVSGTIDESLRHCNTKLCSTHFVSSEVAAERVNRLGEPESRIYVIGSPELDSHSNASGVDIAEVKTRYDIRFDEYGIVIFHPVTSERDTIADQAASLYRCLEASGRSFVVIAPNNDPGSASLFEILGRLPSERFRIIPSMRFNYFSELMKNASIIVGNSSVGVREAPFLGVSSINTGSRQNNRSDSDSIVNVCPFDTQKIYDLLDSSFWGQRHASSVGFGDGRSSERFANILLTKEFWEHPAQKSFN